MKIILSIMVLTGLISFSVLSFLFIGDMDSRSMLECLASLIHGGSACPNDILGLINFHFEAIQFFALATINFYVSVLGILALALIYYLWKNLGDRNSRESRIFSGLPANRPDFFGVKEDLRFWLALHENSPANF